MKTTPEQQFTNSIMEAIELFHRQMIKKRIKEGIKRAKQKKGSN